MKLPKIDFLIKKHQQLKTVSIKRKNFNIFNIQVFTERNWNWHSRNSGVQQSGDVGQNCF